MMEVTMDCFTYDEAVGLDSFNRNSVSPGEVPS